MKKAFCVVLLSMLVCSVAVAAPQTIDLETMTIEELVKLKAQLNLASLKIENFQELSVPEGIYEIGVDIPAGYWTIRPIEGEYAYVRLGKSMNEQKTDIEGYIISKNIESKTSSTYGVFTDTLNVDWKLPNGTFIKISSSSGSVVFTPFTGKTPLMKSEEWQEVIVPQGLYEIGVDIPARYWTISATDGGCTSLSLGRSLDETKTSIKEYNALVDIISETYHDFDVNSDKTHITWELPAGTFLKRKFQRGEGEK